MLSVKTILVNSLSKSGELDEKKLIAFPLVGYEIDYSPQFDISYPRAFGVRKTREGGVYQDNLILSTELIG